MKKNKKSKTSPCPVCSYLTLQERGRFDICPVCFWEDDGSSEGDEPMGEVDLVEARNNFMQIGSSEIGLLPFVRPPYSKELAEGLPTAAQIELRQEKARKKYRTDNNT